jgi:hypothetical protein
LFQQLAPVHTWGHNFLVPVTNIEGNNTIERVRIVASQPNTTIEQIGGEHISAPDGQTGPVYTLNAGQFIEIEVTYSNYGCFINADRPIGVCTYLTTPQFTGGLSDPAQAWLPSIEQLATNALIAALDPPPGTTSLVNHKALIITFTETKEETKVTIGSGLPENLFGGEWKDNIESGMSFYNMPLTNSTESYNFTNQKGFIILGYGYGEAESYYYLAYSSMRDLSAAFFANDIHNTSLINHLFCENEIEIRAEIDGLGVEIDSLKWYIDGIEHLPAQNLDLWNNTFIAGNYEIKLEIYTETNEGLKILEGILHIGAHITTDYSPATGGSTSPLDTCVKVGETISVVAIPDFPDYFFVEWREVLWPSWYFLSRVNIFHVISTSCKQTHITHKQTQTSSIYYDFLFFQSYFNSLRGFDFL